ncbi:hypothetical protein EC973_003844 [Apophysomyces ossiformis]|uniref:AB hydrolase-1 domain-containing protein n=1 Tax=Apophysomyces ossiformis TaxID=679940 RepID=A0A8H7BVJ5_9FUNG|nr:hypothetical protein EC973_003844 [Apophysomyces ossiformis]
MQTSRRMRHLAIVTLVRYKLPEVQPQLVIDQEGHNRSIIKFNFESMDELSFRARFAVSVFNPKRFRRDRATATPVIRNISVGHVGTKDDGPIISKNSIVVASGRGIDTRGDGIHVMQACRQVLPFPNKARPPFWQLTYSVHDFVSRPPASPISRTAPRIDVLREPRLHQTFQYKSRPGGRLKSHRVGFAEYGVLNGGHPTFVIGGHGCMRLVGVVFEELALRYDVVIQLADHLGIERFSLIGQSVGSVYALSIVHKYPSRVLSPTFLISPWVSTHVAKTFKWTRRLPAALVTRTISLAMDVMWMFNRSMPSKERPSESDNNEASSPRTSNTSTSSGSSKKSNFSEMSTASSLTTLTEEEDDLLASLDQDAIDLPTDFPPHRPLRHVVRPRHMSLYLAMNKLRMAEPYSAGQLGDVLVALEKYHSFGFSYRDIRMAVSAVWGDKDGLIPQRAIDSFANSLHDVRLKILDGEGHDLVWKEGVMEWTLRGIAERRKASAKMR